MVITIFDLLLTPIYLIFIFFIASYIQHTKIKKQPLYKWYVRGLMVKLLGAVSVCLIYQFYYTGGDTVAYFDTSTVVAKLATRDSNLFFDVMAGNNSRENLNSVCSLVGWPTYWFDSKAFYVVRLIVPLCLLSFQSFVVTAILLAWICYSGIWKMFLLFNEEFPQLEKQFAISILFIPSVIFWGSGILKDTITISAVGWYTFHFYSFFIQKKYKLWNMLALFVSAYLLIAIKPYILFALLPGSLIWFSNDRLKKLQSKVLRAIAAPFFIAIGVGFSLFFLNQLGTSLGDYSLDKVMDKAVISNVDQKQAYYGGASFDIGKFDADPISMLSKAHLAIGATLFRPYLWDVRNPVMLLSAIENTYIMLLTIFLLFKLKIRGVFSLISENPLLLFSVLFSLFFAFSVGIATSNFGSLVRLKIPCIPFFVSSLFILKYLYEKKSKRKLGI